MLEFVAIAFICACIAAVCLVGLLILMIPVLAILSGVYLGICAAFGALK